MLRKRLLPALVLASLVAPLTATGGKTSQSFQFLVPIQTITDGADPIPQVELLSIIDGADPVDEVTVSAVYITDDADPIPAKVLDSKAIVDPKNGTVSVLTIVDGPDPFGKDMEVTIIVDDPDPVGVWLFASGTDDVDPIPQ